MIQKIILTILFFGLSLHLYSQKAQRLMPEKTRILFVFDASGSMLAKWDNDLRINIARDKLSLLVDSLKVNKNVEFGLRVYGHQFDYKLNNCKDSKLEVSFAANNHQQIKAVLNRIKPQGTTPIAYSLEQASQDFPDDKNYRNVIVMITDGIESCSGDPCAISLSMQKNGIILKPFIIGLGVGKDFTKAFECIGKAYDARNSTDFARHLAYIARQTLSRSTITVELTDERDRPIETGVNMTFINNTTNEPVYDLIHYRDTRGKTDTLEIDPVLGYDLIVSTIPPVGQKGIVLEGGRHTTVRIKAPQGTLSFNMKTPREYGNLQAIIRQAGKDQTLHAQTVTQNEKYLAGRYDVEVLTYPRTYFKDVQIKQGQATELSIEQPGVVNIVNYFDGAGSIYLMAPNGSQQWVRNIAFSGKADNIALQPGNYKIVFRANEAKGSNYTSVRKFTVQPGKATMVDLVK